MQDIRDREIFEGILKNDQVAFKMFVEKYKQIVFRTIYSFLRNKEDTEDIAQEVFIEVVKNAHKFRFESEISTWLYRISVNRSLNYLKKKKAKRWFSDFKSIFDKDNELDNIKAGSDPLLETENKQLNDALNRALETLTYKQKIAFTLNKIEGLSNSEAAKIMNVSVSSVDVLVFKAKKNLQIKLKSVLKQDG